VIWEEEIKLNQKNSQKNNNLYLKYSSIAFQMGAIITLGTFGGKWLDSFFNLKFPIFVITLAILSVFLAVFYAIKDIIRLNK